MKGFKGVNYISFPFPKLAWHNGIGRRNKKEANRASRMFFLELPEHTLPIFGFFTVSMHAGYVIYFPSMSPAG